MGFRDSAGKLMPEVCVGNFEVKVIVLGLHGVRYQVTDVARSVAFYTDQLGFKLDFQRLPAFASVSIDKLTLLRSGPGASGSARAIWCGPPTPRRW